MTPFCCPCCWRKIAENDVGCPWCGVDIRAASDKPFSEKLRVALRHSARWTRVRAAWILGEFRESAATQDLMALVAESGDSFVAEAAAEALGKIAATEAFAVLERAERRGTGRVRRAARQAIEQIRLSHSVYSERRK